MSFSIRTTTTTGDVAVVEARGDLGAGSAECVRTCVDAALGEHPIVLVDLARVTSVDCAVLGTLVTAARWASRRGGRLVVTETSRSVRSLLEDFDLHSVLVAPDPAPEEQLPRCAGTGRSAVGGRP